MPNQKQIKLGLVQGQYNNNTNNNNNNIQTYILP